MEKCLLLQSCLLARFFPSSKLVVKKIIPDTQMKGKFTVESEHLPEGHETPKYSVDTLWGKSLNMRPT